MRPERHIIIPVRPGASDRVLTVVRAIERRQPLPAFRREPRHLGMRDVAKHFCTVRLSRYVTLSLFAMERCAACGEQKRERSGVGGRAGGIARSTGRSATACVPSGLLIDTGMVVASPQ